MSADKKITIVFISDTHNRHGEITLPDGDILVHCGDLTGRGTLNEIRTFGEWMHEQKGFAHKIVIAGNHDWEFERNPDAALSELLGIGKVKHDIIYLRDSEVAVEVRGRTLRIYGSPWQPYFQDWAFNLLPDQLKEVWSKIPDGLDVLITHGPPLGVLDRIRGGEHVGCEYLLDEVLRAKPKIHAYGHIHESYGIRREVETVFVNASTCTLNYIPSNKALIVEI